MFAKEKYFKNNQSLNHSDISKNIISSNKYYQRTYRKTKKQNTKKNIFNRLWKKQSSYVNWPDKENDKNNQNYTFNKKPHYDNKKALTYHKISFSELNKDSNIKKEENKNKNENDRDIEFEKDEKVECDSKEEISKDEKNNSFENTITTAYSNTLSVHEESSNNTINLNENLNNNEFKLNIIESNLNENNNNYYGIDISQNPFIPKRKLIEENNSKNERDTNESICLNSMKNLNFIRLNFCPNLIGFSSFPSSKIPKEDNSSEPFNKYNAINQELNQLMINPITENTEILNLSPSISSYINSSP